MLFSKVNKFVNICCSDIILSRNYTLSSVTGVQVGIYIDEELKPSTKIRLVNKNDLAIDLSIDVLASMFEGDYWGKIKKYLKSNRDDEQGATINLDAQTKLSFSKVFKRKSITIANTDDITISFYDTTCHKFKLMFFAIKNYYIYLTEELNKVVIEIPQIKKLFLEHFYVSTNDDKILKVIFKSNEINKQNTIQCELALICHKKFLAFADKVKREENSMTSSQ